MTTLIAKEPRLRVPHHPASLDTPPVPRRVPLYWTLLAVFLTLWVAPFIILYLL